MPGTPIHQDIEALSHAGDKLREALLSHDLPGVRLPARQMAGMAGLLGFGGVEAAALILIEALSPEGTIPDPAYGPAVFALSDALNDATRLIGHA
jgi:hypothetical protein